VETAALSTTQDEPHRRLATRHFPYRVEKVAYISSPKLALPTGVVHRQEVEDVDTRRTTPLHREPHQISPKPTYPRPPWPQIYPRRWRRCHGATGDAEEVTAALLKQGGRRDTPPATPRAVKVSRQGHDTMPENQPPQRRGRRGEMSITTIPVSHAGYASDSL
jgi:hypothetical protein